MVESCDGLLMFRINYAPNFECGPTLRTTEAVSESFSLMKQTLFHRIELEEGTSVAVCCIWRLPEKNCKLRNMFQKTVPKFSNLIGYQKPCLEH